VSQDSWITIAPLPPKELSRRKDGRFQVRNYAALGNVASSRGRDAPGACCSRNVFVAAAPPASGTHVRSMRAACSQFTAKGLAFNNSATQRY